MRLPGNCSTTAMGILPHENVDDALRLALSVDIPFWPQLPRTSFYEDMYVQVSEHLPGVLVDHQERVVSFDLAKFYAELPAYVEQMDNLDYFQLSPRYSMVYSRFLEHDLGGYAAIRGQCIGPVSFGLKIVDEHQAPMIYNDEARGFLYEFIAQKVTGQYRELIKKNPRAFVWLDEPGLELVFAAFVGYSSETALADYRRFLRSLPGPKGVHLCGNPDWSFLLGLELDILSVDVLAWGHIFTRYTDELKAFLHRGGIISWGITPILTEEMQDISAHRIVNRLEELWDYLAARGMDKRTLLSQAWLAPARCCLINADGFATVEQSFRLLREVSLILKDKYNLG